MTRPILLAAGLAMTLTASAARAGSTPLGSVFTYQGVLKTGGNAYNGTADVVFTLHDAASGGIAIGGTLSYSGLVISDGTITASLNFGSAVFDGNERWLEIAVRAPAGAGSFTTLVPRQRVAATPYALQALSLSSVQSSPYSFNNAANSFTGESLSIDSGTLHVDAVNNRLGIGTTTPAARLHVAGDVALNGDGFGMSLLGFSNNLTARINRLDLPGGGLTIADHATGPIILATSTSMGAAGERMRVTPQGDVGIGTTNPAARLHVNGNVALAGDGFGLSLLGFSNNLTARINRLDLPGGGLTIADHATGPIILATSTSMGAAGERMRVTPQGDVGIGTLSPQARLHVAGNVSLSGDGFGLSLLGFSNNLIGRINRLDLPGGGLTIADHATGPIVLATSTSMGAAGERMRVTPEGRVGIGTASPQTGLHVQGAGFPGAFLSLESVGGNGDAGVRMGRDGGVHWHMFNSGSTGDTFNLYNASFQPVIAGLQNGNVGIGTTSPLQKLSVNGNAGKTDGPSWSVFSDARLKTNIHDLPSGSLDRLLRLRGREFQYTDAAVHDNLGTAGPQIGFIAQEVQDVLPEWIDQTPNGYLSLTERGTTAMMVEALRELRAEKDSQISALQCALQVRDLETAALRDEVNDLRELVGRLLAKEEVR